MRDASVRCGAVLFLIAAIVDALVLYEQREGGYPHPTPDPKSDHFPSDVMAFAGPKASWSCNWNAAFNNMMAERRKERIFYWCQQQKVNAREK